MMTHAAGCRLGCLMIALALVAGPGCVSFGDDGTARVSAATGSLHWDQLPDLPVEMGVAGPFVGVHHDVLIVGGGANFPSPVWETEKTWHDDIFVLRRTAAGLIWSSAGKLPRPIGYGAAVSTPEGVVCMGGNDATTTFEDAFLLSWDASANRLARRELPPLPMPCAYGQAVLIGSVVYLAGGQSGTALETAMSSLWALDLSQLESADRLRWRVLENCPGPARAFQIVAGQHNDEEECLYVISGRRQGAERIEFLTDVWEYAPSAGVWRERAAAPRCFAAGTGIGFGRDQILVLGGDDGKLFDRTDELRDGHPGFPRDVHAYNARTDSWAPLGESPRNQVTTIPVRWGDRVIIASGEVRPRVRTPAVWSVAPKPAVE